MYLLHMLGCNYGFYDQTLFKLWKREKNEKKKRKEPRSGDEIYKIISKMFINFHALNLAQRRGKRNGKTEVHLN